MSAASASTSDVPSRAPPTCSVCNESGHRKNSPHCPLNKKDPVPRPSDTILTVDWTPTILDDTELNSVIDKKITQCESCKKFSTDPLQEWRGVNECLPCYSVHKAEIDAIWEIVKPQFPCQICGRVWGCGVSFHWDHVNMFEKNDSVCVMVKRGDSVEKIMAEKDKCQVLCASCHSIVTDIENRMGFRKAKINLTRAHNGTCAGGARISPEEEAVLLAAYKKQYEEHLIPLYPKIKARVCG